MPSPAPIGVFDSGIGGLTVVRELARQLPAEDVIYFGDTARVPYGPKSPETVRRYAHEITSYLREEGVKAVVVACNTATAHALDSLRESFDLPIIGVVEPGARAAAAAAPHGHVAVIGTHGTVSSGAYDRALEQVDPAIDVTSIACPLFVPFVEEGWLDHPALRLVAHEYLDRLAAAPARVDALVLACTHYPLLKHVIADTIGPAIRLVDSAEETAAATARELAARDIRHPDRARRGTYRFVASDAPGTFLRLASRFLGAPVEAVQTVTLG